MCEYCSILFVFLSTYNIYKKTYKKTGACFMNDKPLIIKKRGDDGTKIISLRIRQEILDELDRIAKECNYSRNEIINLMLEYGIENVQIR